MNQAWFSQVKFVMVQTSHSGNIGAAARALKTMNFSKLALVSPKLFPCEEATARASSAADVLNDAQVFDNIEDAIADCHFIVGASARNRSMPWPLQDARNACIEMSGLIKSDQKVAILFGRESSGLTNDELSLCHAHIQIPANENYSSLNIASAMQVIGYELRTQLMDTNISAVECESLASAKQHELFYEHLEKTLKDIEFLDQDNPRMLMQKFKRLFAKAKLETTEMNILRGMLSKIDKNKQ
ncbi:RNA methyltransferase [Marinicellulosiphila megalodicopiae]|uniref:RNA methyltransferase n=1 Tax=Marinicellulosiphila megalodicopiae TaxID=2724896 RepID=UPI003BAF9F01